MIGIVAPAAVDPGGPAPRFVVRADKELCQVELAADPVLFDITLAARRPAERYHSSPWLGVHAGRAAYSPDAPAWQALRRNPFLYYRAIARDSGFFNILFSESTAPAGDPSRAPSLRIARPASGRPRAPRGLSGDLPRLHVDRNRVVNPAGDVVVLRGVTHRGLEATGETLTRADVRTLTRDWRANLLRLALDQQRALTDPRYLLSLDAVIRWAAAEDAYTLLAVTRLDDREWGRFPSGAANRTPPLPEENTLRLLSMLAARYRAEPAVLYELFDEPHEPLANDTTYPLRGRPTATTWHEWARRIADAVRRAAPEALLVVSGWRWGLDLRSFPVPVAAVPMANAVYSTHVPEAHPEGLPTGDAGTWDTWFGFERLRSAHPVAAGAWSGTTLVWADGLERYLRDKHRFRDGQWGGISGWAHAAAGNLLDAAGTPTELGELVRGALRTMAAAATADFDAARPRGTRTRDRIAVAEARTGDFLVVAGHDFQPGCRVVVAPSGAAAVRLRPRTVLPHLLLVAQLPATVPLGAADIAVDRPDGTRTESVNINVQAAAADRVLWTGSTTSVPPYTLLFLANPAVERRNGTVVRDPIQTARPAYHRAVADAIGHLFGGSESLLLPYAADIWIVSRFAPAPVAAASALVSQHPGGEAWSEEARVAAHLATIGQTVDHCFVVFRSTTHSRDTTTAAQENPHSGGRTYTFDARTGHHLRVSSVPGTTALSTPTDPVTALHEFLHGMEELIDLYVDTAPAAAATNRKRRASAHVARPAAYATLDGIPYRTDPARDGLGYGRWLSYHAELVDRRRPNVMDDYFRADTALRCRLDLLSLRLARDRLEIKLRR